MNWNHLSRRATGLILLVFGLGIGAAISSDDDTVRVATQFLASLEPAQKSQLSFEMDDEERFNFHYIPRPRKGVPLKEMTPAQRKLAYSLLGTALSSRGLSEAAQIMFLEQILYVLENQSPRRDPDAYFFSVFGKPSQGAPWGWRFEGHHLSLNVTLKGNGVVSTGPAFFGTNPAIVRSGPHAGMQVLRAEQEWGRRLVQSFNETLLKRAVINADAPDDIITAFSREFDLGEPAGVSFGDMNEVQAKLLTQLIHRYANRFRSTISDAEIVKIQEQGMEKVYFAWAGGTRPGDPHYYRIHGPTFVIEYDNTQNQANHIHTVWRDIQNDFGKDVLREHYQHSH